MSHSSAAAYYAPELAGSTFHTANRSQTATALQCPPCRPVPSYNSCIPAMSLSSVMACYAPGLAGSAFLLTGRLPAVFRSSVADYHPPGLIGSAFSRMFSGLQRLAFQTRTVPVWPPTWGPSWCCCPGSGASASAPTTPGSIGISLGSNSSPGYLPTSGLQTSGLKTSGLIRPFSSAPPPLPRKENPGHGTKL